MSKLSHCLKIIMLLQTHQMINSKKIAEILNITPRNVKAYIEYLREAGVPVEGMTGRRGGYFLADAYYLEPPAWMMPSIGPAFVALHKYRVLLQKN